MTRSSRLAILIAAVLIVGLQPVAVLAANDPPIAVDDPGTACDPTTPTGGAFPIPEDWLMAGPYGDWFSFFGPCGLLINDTDPNEDPMTWNVATDPSHGQVLKLDETSFAYRPDPNFSTRRGDEPGGTWVSDSFTYVASDGTSNSQPATMRLWVFPVNDPPTFAAGGLVTVFENSGAYSGTWATDVSAGPLESYQTVTFEFDPFPVEGYGVGPLFETLPAIDSAGTLTFKVRPNTYGIAHMTVRAKDDGGVENVVGPPTPQADDTGEDVTFDIVVLQSLVATVDDATQIAEDPATSPSPIDVLANDAFPAGSTVTTVTQGALGMVTIAPDGLSVLYAPATNANGSDAFTYTVDDGAGSTDTAAVHVTIDPVNDDPVALADDSTVAEDAAATSIDVLVNDTDPESDPRTITGKTDGSKGVVVLASSTTLTYKPNANATGSDTFTYTISDGQGGSGTGIVNVTITSSNDTPNAVNDSGFSVPESAGATVLAVKANDTDPDGDSLTITGKTNGVHGIVTITGGGTGLTYDPAQLYYGTDHFTYTVSDGHGGSDTATVLLTVVKDATRPVATAPSERFIGQSVGSVTTKARLTWSGTDTGGTGIKSYLLQVSVNGGAYTTIALPTATATTIDRTLTDGRSYRYRVRSTDRQGNVGAFAYGPAFTPARFQNSNASIVYSGAWTTVASASALGGSVRYASSTSARASLTRSVRDFAWVTTRTPTSGSAQVWIDGVFAATINLRTTATAYRQLVFQRHFSTLGTHKIEIRPIGGGRIHLDAFLVYR